MTCIHRYSIMQGIFTALKLLCTLFNSLSLQTSDNHTAVLVVFFFLISIVLPWLFFVTCGPQGLHSWHRTFLVKERTVGRLSLDPCHHLSATGFTILAVGQDPLLFFWTSKEGKKKSTLIPCKRGKKGKGKRKFICLWGEKEGRNVKEIHFCRLGLYQKQNFHPASNIPVRTRS